MTYRGFVRCVIGVALVFLCTRATPLYSQTPVGMLAPFVSTFCPVGWVGTNTSQSYSVVEQSLYPYLFQMLLGIGQPNLGDAFHEPYTYPPDMRGRFVRGYDPQRVIDPDTRNLASFQLDSFQGHAHAIWEQHTNGAGGTQGLVGTNLPSTAQLLQTVVRLPVTGVNGTPRYSNETRPNNIALLWCVKALPDIIQSTTGVITMNISSFTLVDVSTTAAMALTPGIFKYFTIGDVSFWFGVIMALVVIWGFKAGGLK